MLSTKVIFALAFEAHALSQESIHNLRLETLGAQWWYLKRMVHSSLEPKGYKYFVERKVDNLK